MKSDDVTKLMQLFAHRRDVYAVQVKSGDDYIYVPRYEEISEEVIKAHIEGKITLGIYTLGLDNKVKWICFDIDHAHIENPEEACKLILERCIARFGESAVRVEESGTPHNYHVWVFFAEPIEAMYARALGLIILEDIEHVELFPKQTALTGKGLGNLVKLPCGLHQKSGRWSTMNIEGVIPCTLDISKIELPAPKIFEEKDEKHEGYKGRDPNCILKIKKGVKAGGRNNAGIVLASYLVNFRQLGNNVGYYTMRLWNTKNKPRLNYEELRAIFDQAIKGGYVFGCNHELVKEYCIKERCVFA